MPIVFKMPWISWCALQKFTSLSRLSSGIAQKIKKLPNYVNNISVVSLEMIDEALQEIHQIDKNEHAGILAKSVDKGPAPLMREEKK